MQRRMMLALILAYPLCYSGDADKWQRDNMKNLKQLGLGLLMYSGDYSGKFPKALDTLKKDGYLRDDSLLNWINPGTGKSAGKFIYCPGLRDDNANAATWIIVASPRSFKGKRVALYIDGHVGVVSEPDFIKQAKRQNWKVRVIPKKYTGSAELKKKVEALIPKLGAESFKDRRAARKALEKLGKDILPLLEKNLKNDDPEIRGNLRTVIDNIFDKM